MEAIAGRLGLLGRTSRTTILNFLILCFVGAVVLWFVGLVQLRQPNRVGALLVWLPYLRLALTLVFLWLSIRRFHDQDRPGWIAVIAAGLGILVVPTGFGIAVRAPFVPLPDIVTLTLTIIYLVALCLPGTIGPNRFGPDPRGWKSREHYIDQQRALGRR